MSSGVEEFLNVSVDFWMIKKEIARDVSASLDMTTLAPVQLPQLAPDLTFALRQFLWNIYLHDRIEIAAFSRNARQPLFAQSKSLTHLPPEPTFHPTVSSHPLPFYFL